MDAAIKKIPYGMTDFERIILENYYYVDKTQYIAKVEKSDLPSSSLSVLDVSEKAFS